MPQAVAFHRKSLSAGHHSKFKAFHVERNRLFNLIKLFPADMVVASPFWTLLRYTLQTLAALAGQGAAGRFVRRYSRFELLWILARALASSLRAIPAMVRQRTRLKRHRRLEPKAFRALLRRHALPALDLFLKD